MATPLPTALLIGSWKYDSVRPVRGSDGEESGRGTNVDKKTAKVDKKGNIKRAFTKEGPPVPAKAWVVGDLDNMETLIERRNIDLFYRLDYEEKNSKGVFARGKKDVLEKIEEFFKQEGRTHYILYFSGHGNKDGSWCFAMSTRANIDPVSITRPGQGEIEAAFAATPIDRETAVELHDDTMQHEAGKRTPSPKPKVVKPASEPDAREVSADSQPDSASLYDIVESEPVKDDPDTPDPVNEWNELVKYEDVIALWEKCKQGRGERYLMLILDCCHSGRWVQMVNGEAVGEEESTAQENKVDQYPKLAEATPGPEQEEEEEVSAAQPVGAVSTSADKTKYEKRDDVCIQAACRPAEVCMVAENQYSSVFTRAFVAAQNRTSLEKLLLTLFDHAFVLNFVSMYCSPKDHLFTPMTSQYAPFADIKFFDSFDDMYLKTK